MPTSMTMQPGFSHSPLTNFAFPMAATTMSAWRTSATMSFVREWQIVTVASIDCRIAATGIPTMLERPMTTALFPRISTPLRCSSSMHPAGVQGTASGGSPPLRQRLPMLTAEKPSASLSTRIDFSTVCSSMCFGRGSWTKMAWTCGFWLSFSISSSTSCWLTLAGRSTSMVWNSTSAAAFFLFLTYVCESLFSPTRTTAKPGRTACSCRSLFESSFTSARTSAAIALPSILRVATSLGELWSLISFLRLCRYRSSRNPRRPPRRAPPAVLMLTRCHI
mmetsp:Transcript_21074/g.59237  ORF Transcript_21074/g.59237 Transcript_21074/m.59237 type:complete len:278 (+) Transcript_21074:66-899(+)